MVSQPLLGYLKLKSVIFASNSMVSSDFLYYNHLQTTIASINYLYK